MNFSFKKFIPKVMQDTKWGSLTEVWQSLYVNIRDEKIKAIFNQYDIDNITEQELRDLAVMFGFNLKTLDGYTSTLDFIKKEMVYLIPRLVSKTTPTCYQIQGIPFNLISNGYSVIYDDINNNYIVDETLRGSSFYGTTTLDREDKGYTYVGSIVNLDGFISLDGSTIYYTDTTQRISVGTYLDLDPSFLDFTEFPTLDGATTLYSLTRNMAFGYTYKFVESASEFMSLNTLKVLKSDVDQFKRVTDRCYYEPYLHFTFNKNNTVYEKPWTDYQGNILATQKNILIATKFQNFKTIRFGIGAHTTIDITITDVANYSFQIDYPTRKNEITTSNYYYNFRLLIIELQKFTAFTEIAILDNLGNCILYSTFPKVQWDENMYSNLKFEFEAI